MACTKKKVEKPADDDMFSLGTAAPSKRYVPAAGKSTSTPRAPMVGPSGPLGGPSGPMGGPSGPMITKKKK